MKALSIGVKTLREMLRQPLVMAIAFGFPLALLLMYHFSFGKSDEGFAAMLSVQIANHDTVVGQDTAAKQLLTALRAEKFEGAAMFGITEVTDEQTARTALREHKAVALVVIEAGFGERVKALREGKPTQGLPRIVLQGDASADMFEFTKALLEDTIRREIRRQTGRPNPLPMPYDFIEGTGTASDFDVGVPGIIVFGILLTIVSAAMSLVREHSSGTLRRLKLTRAGAADILGGVAFAHSCEALLQAPLILLVAVLFGFTLKGSFALALLVCLLLAFSAIGLGMVVACFTKSDGEAANLGSAVLVPMAFLSGALFPMPEAPLLTMAGRTVSTYDLLPSTHAVEALRQIMLHGQDLVGISWQLGWLAAQSVLVFALGVALYRRLRMKAE